MEKREYGEKMEQIQKLLQKGRFTEAKEAIYELRTIYPYSIKYICENVALMLTEGKEKEYCRTILDNICQEYYICDELVDVFQTKKSIYEVDSIEYRLCDFSEKLYMGDQRENEYWEDLNEKKAFFLSVNDDNKKKQLKEIAEAYYVVRNMNMYVVLSLAWCYCNGKISECEQYIHEDAGQAFYGFYNVNLGYLLDLCRDDESYTFVLVDGVESVNQDIDILAYALQLMGNRTIIVRQPMIEMVAENEHVKYSMLQAATESGSIIIHPVLDGATNKKMYIERTLDIIQFLTESLEERTALTVFAADEIMDDLHDVKKHAKHLQRLSERKPMQFSYGMAFAWVGDYCKYMSYIYGFSVRDRIGQPAECDVSIVIPVRNSADTLRYTLQTCLNQQTDADYEIVLSDNSDKGNTEVYDLYKELADERIKYYHTPFVLNLTKSFEFAFLHARGKFITSVGADDGIYPWAVQFMKESLPYMTESNILHWNRSFYAWPNFSVEQENMLSFNMYDNERPFTLQKYALRENFTNIIKNLRDCLYGLPACYINSGFKREFFQELLTNTGRLWDGISQDLYISAVNLLNNKFCYHFDIPLTMAGMSGHSQGASDGGLDQCFDELVQKINKYHRTIHCQKGEYASRKSEALFPYINGSYADVIGVYRQFVRVEEICPEYSIGMDRKKSFLGVLNTANSKDVFFYSRLYNVYYGLEQIGNEEISAILNTKTINFDLVEDCAQNKEKSKLYKVRFDENTNNLCLDAANFDIKNVKEAIDFVGNIINIKVNCADS